MSSNPNSMELFDGWFPTNNTHEFDYFKQSVQMVAPGHTEEQIVSAISICRKTLNPTEGRARLLECVQQRLGRDLPRTAGRGGTTLEGSSR